MKPDDEPMPASAADADSGRRTWPCLLALYTCIAVLHLLGWGLCLHYSAQSPALLGLGLTAYLLGLRHAFDADHIAAVDDTVRYLLQRRRSPLAAGFFFSLGHSSVVLALTVAVALAAVAVGQRLPQLQSFGGIVGAGISGVFLWLIGLLNLCLLLDLAKVWRRHRNGGHDPDELEALLNRRGLFNRLLGGRLRGFIQHSWQMYPLGLLFGLGFDTASSVGLLAVAAGAAAGTLPLAILSLPLLFAAGMTALDTTDGVLMCKAYQWALTNPLRKLRYNLVITALSVLVALVIGTFQLLQVLARIADSDRGLLGWIAGLDFGPLGYAIVALFLLAWAASLYAGRRRRPGAGTMQEAG